MFKIRDGKIKVFTKYVQMLPGTHTILVDAETGAISYNSGEPVVEYTYNEDTGHVAIESKLSGIGEDYKAPTRGRSWMNNRKLSSGPLYESHDINVFFEGLGLDFNYNGIAFTGVAIKSFIWTGGRVCFDDMFSSGATNQHRYTAIPAAGSCGTALTGMYDTGEGQIRDIMSFGGSGLLHAAAFNGYEWYGNAVSIVFSYRSFRKYLSFARGLNGVFESSLGPMGASKGDVEPDGSFPNTFDAGFKFSMFNLKQ